MGTEVRERAIYTLGDAARILRIGPTTVRDWTGGPAPLVVPAEPGRLSFMNLVELQVVRAMRQGGLKLSGIRSAVEAVKRFLPGPHPLASHRFETDGVDVFLREVGPLLNLSQGGQVAMREVMAPYLRAIVRDESGMPVRLWVDKQARVQVDPSIAFGRPTISTGGSVEIIRGRFRAGEPIAELAEDFGVGVDVIEAALAYAA